MPQRYKLSAAADHDIVEILRTTEQRFGEAAADRYLVLIETALNDLVTDPERVGSRVAAEIDPSAQLYNIRHSLARAGEAGRVMTPRHFMLYRFDEDAVGVGRLLHESMDLPSHATNDYGEDRP